MDKNITILEYMNEYGAYLFYGAYESRNPKNAVENYLAENNLENEKIEEDDGEFFIEGVCRAYEVELE